jgi:Saxitoxin biosynthesis operon protein SxtJ
MALVEINWKPDRRELRNFGVAMIVGFGLLALAARFWWDAPTLALVFVIVGAVAGLLGLSGTRAAMLVYLPWMAVAFVMGNIVSRVLVAAFFYLMITPMGLFMRVFGKDALQRKNTRSSYWDDLPPPADRERYERQF